MRRPSLFDPVVQLGDGIGGLLSLGESSADLLLSDLPSGETAAAFDRQVDLGEFWPAAWRALKRDGVVVLMASSIRFASSVIRSQPDSFRYGQRHRAEQFLRQRRRDGEEE